MVDQPWNQRPFVPYGLGGYNHCVSPVDTHCEIETKCDASRGLHRIQGWTPCSDRAGHPLSVERVYSTAQQYMHQTHRTRLRVGAQNARKLSHVAMSPPAFYPFPLHSPTSPSSSGRVGGISENQVSDPNYTCVCRDMYMDIRVTVLAHLPDRIDRQADRQTDRQLN